jgi:hypothetical protein
VSHSEQASIRNRNKNREKLALIAFSRQMRDSDLPRIAIATFARQLSRSGPNTKGDWVSEGMPKRRRRGWRLVRFSSLGGRRVRVQSRWGSPASLSSWYRTHGLANGFLWALNLRYFTLRVLARIFQPQASCPKIRKGSGGHEGLEARCRSRTRQGREGFRSAERIQRGKGPRRPRV